MIRWEVYKRDKELYEMYIDVLKRKAFNEFGYLSLERYLDVIEDKYVWAILEE